MTKIVPLRLKPLKNINNWLVWEVKYRLHFLNISFRSRNIQVFKICKLAKWWCHTLNQILTKYVKARYLNQFVPEMIESWQNDLITRCVLQYEIISSAPWQHTGFQTSPMLKAFLASFGVPFWYFPVILYLPDLASI